MYYIYFLFSEKDKGIYIGRTNNIKRRFQEHQSGKVQSTKSRRPLKLLGYEICENEQESVRMENEWKKGHKREEIKRRFKLI